ncbi:MAG: hypothetical protein JWQ19_1155 [Subtercola sp.]|nr:hypothetical protein [Subtercola sp.]
MQPDQPEEPAAHPDDAAAQAPERPEPLERPEPAAPDARLSPPARNAGADADVPPGPDARPARNAGLAPAPGSPPARAGVHLPAARARSRAAVPIAVVTVAVLVLAGLFLLGTRLPGILTAAPAATPTPTQTPTPTPTPTPTSTAGPQLAGSYDWSDLRGGECISPFVSAWQQKFTVVECAAAHYAQVMSTGSLSTDPAAAYPGQDAIKQQLNLLCQTPANFNDAILSAYPDIVWQANYPVNDAQWQAGLRNYYCFVSRSSSQPITGNFAPPAFGG